MDTLFDLMLPFEEFLTILNSHGVCLADVKYFPAYREYLSMRAGGMTYYAALEEIRDRYGWPVGTMRKKVEMFSQRLSKRA